MKSREDSEVHIVYHRVGFESKAGHHVRSRMEAMVCDWLMSHRVAHRHGSEVFTVRLGARATPTVYVPDIVLHDTDKSGKTVILEPFDASTPRVGSTRIIACFRKEMNKNYSIIFIVKNRQKNKVLKGAYDVLVDFSDLDALEKYLPQIPK